MQCSKAPGRESVNSEFSQTFSVLISPLLLDVFNESFDAILVSNHPFYGIPHLKPCPLLVVFGALNLKNSPDLWQGL